MKDIRKKFFDKCLVYVLCHARRYDLAIVCTSLEKPDSTKESHLEFLETQHVRLTTQGIDPEAMFKKQKQQNQLHSLLDVNLRYSIYNVIEFEYNEFNQNNLELFSSKLNIDIDTISNLLIGSNPILSKEDFVKICNYFDPSLYIMVCWQEMHVEI